MFRGFSHLGLIVLAASVISPCGIAVSEEVPKAGTIYVAKTPKTSPAKAKLARVRDALHRNLDGKGDGFIVGWRFDASTFTLTIDKSKYQQNMVYAATMTARSIFDLEGVRLPKRLVILDRSGEILGEGPFSNVPKIVD
jgi:hypothetical protein